MDLRQDIRTSWVPLKAFILMGLFWGAFGAYVPEIKAQAGLSDGKFGLALLCGAFGGLAAMWAAPRVDHNWGGWAMVGAAGLLIASFTMPGLAQNWTMLALAVLACMGTSGLLDVVMNVRLSEIEATSGRALMNLNHALYSFAYGGAALTAGLARESGVSAQVFFLCVCAIALVLASGLYQVAGDVASEDHKKESCVPVLLVVLAGFAGAIAFVAEQATDNWSALHLERSYGGSPSEGALGPAMLGFTMGLGRLWGQAVLARLSEGRVLRLAALISAAGTVLAAWAPSKELAIVGFAILGLGVSVVAPMILAWVGKTVAPESRAMAISRVVFLCYSGFFLGPPTLGLLAQLFGLPIAFTVLASLLAMISVVVVPWMRKSAG